MEKKWYDNSFVKKKLIEGRDTPPSECLSGEEVEWNQETQEAMEETERLLADPNTKYYDDVEEALKELKQ